MTIKTFQAQMITKAKRRGGIYENFGQAELSKIKDKYKYNDLLKSDDCLTAKQIDTRTQIDALSDWCATYTG